MSAFYKITKGNSLSSCKSNPNFQDTVEKTVKEEIDECNYFSRNRVRTDVKNPVVRIINIFNNNVQTVTQKAFNMFMDMMKQ